MFPKGLVLRTGHPMYAELCTPGGRLYVPSLSVVMSLSFSASAGQPLTWCFRRGLGERFIRELTGKTEIILTGLGTIAREKLQEF